MDMRVGLEIELDCRQRVLRFRYKGELTGVEIDNLPDTPLYPYLVYNSGSVFPVQITYIGGPKSEYHNIQRTNSNKCDCQT